MPVNNIGDYALIGDCHSSALVGRDGSIDWACFPRFDSPSVFAKVLDATRGGSFAVTPRNVESVTRAYVDGTNVLTTTFRTSSGVVELTDCMPVAPMDPARPAAVQPHRALLRHARCTDGSVELDVVIAPRFEYGSFVPRFRLTSQTSAEIVGGADALWVTATRPVRLGEERVEATWRLARGEQVWLDVTWTASHEDRPPPAPNLRHRLQDTIAFWKAWSARCRYEGDHRGAVVRSALVLKALTYSPSGAVVAAPTTSLPEEVGGERNWDYRYTWIRDATLTLISLFVLGFTDEAAAFKRWLERTGAGRPRDLQIMYGICGERALPEMEIPYLAGHRDSGPVRIGNGAVKQLQLDCYGQLLEAGYLFAKAGGTITEENWTFLSGLADIVCETWRQPDRGIWEIRDDPRHFVHSKLNCWVALDRAIRIATARHLPAPLDAWAQQRDRLRDYLVDEAAGGGWFAQAVGSQQADASTLLVPALGLLPTTHPLVTKTIEVIERDLTHDGLVHRYKADDGLQGGEGAFLLCSFWLLDCYTHAGRLDEAGALLEKLLGLANDVGLFAEEAEPVTGEALGNFPQAFTHMALVTSCAHLSAARRGEVPADGAHDYAELALDRLLTSKWR